MWHRGLAEQLSLLCDSFVSDRLLDVRNFMINNNKIAECLAKCLAEGFWWFSGISAAGISAAGILAQVWLKVLQKAPS